MFSQAHIDSIISAVPAKTAVAAAASGGQGGSQGGGKRPSNAHVAVGNATATATSSSDSRSREELIYSMLAPELSQWYRLLNVQHSSSMSRLGNLGSDHKSTTAHWKSLLFLFKCTSFSADDIKVILRESNFILESIINHITADIFSANNEVWIIAVELYLISIKSCGIYIWQLSELNFNSLWDIIFDIFQRYNLVGSLKSASAASSSSSSSSSPSSSSSKSSSNIAYYADASRMLESQCGGDEVLGCASSIDDGFIFLMRICMELFKHTDFIVFSDVYVDALVDVIANALSSLDEEVQDNLAKERKEFILMSAGGNPQGAAARTIHIINQLYLGIKEYLFAFIMDAQAALVAIRVYEEELSSDCGGQGGDGEGRGDSSSSSTFQSSSPNVSLDIKQKNSIFRAEVRMKLVRKLSSMIVFDDRLFHYSYSSSTTTSNSNSEEFPNHMYYYFDLAIVLLKCQAALCCIPLDRMLVGKSNSSCNISSNSASSSYSSSINIIEHRCYDNGTSNNVESAMESILFDLHRQYDNIMLLLFRIFNRFNESTRVAAFSGNFIDKCYKDVMPLLAPFIIASNYCGICKISKLLLQLILQTQSASKTMHLNSDCISQLLHLEVYDFNSLPLEKQKRVQSSSSIDFSNVLFNTHVVLVCNVYSAENVDADALVGTDVIPLDYRILNSSVMSIICDIDIPVYDSVAVLRSCLNVKKNPYILDNSITNGRGNMLMESNIAISKRLASQSIDVLLKSIKNVINDLYRNKIFGRSKSNSVVSTSTFPAVSAGGGGGSTSSNGSFPRVGDRSFDGFHKYGWKLLDNLDELLAVQLKFVRENYFKIDNINPKLGNNLVETVSKSEISDILSLLKVLPRPTRLSRDLTIEIAYVMKPSFNLDKLANLHGAVSPMLTATSSSGTVTSGSANPCFDCDALLREIGDLNVVSVLYSSSSLYTNNNIIGSDYNNNYMNIAKSANSSSWGVSASTNSTGSSSSSGNSGNSSSSSSSSNLIDLTGDVVEINAPVIRQVTKESFDQYSALIAKSKGKQAIISSSSSSIDNGYNDKLTEINNHLAMKAAGGLASQDSSAVQYLGTLKRKQDGELNDKSNALNDVSSAAKKKKQSSITDLLWGKKPKKEVTTDSEEEIDDDEDNEVDDNDANAKLNRSSSSNNNKIVDINFLRGLSNFNTLNANASQLKANQSSALHQQKPPAPIQKISLNDIMKQSGMLDSTPSSSSLSSTSVQQIKPSNSFYSDLMKSFNKPSSSSNLASMDNSIETNRNNNTSNNLLDPNVNVFGGETDKNAFKIVKPESMQLVVIDPMAKFSASLKHCIHNIQFSPKTNLVDILDSIPMGDFYQSLLKTDLAALPHVVNINDDSETLSGAKLTPMKVRFSNEDNYIEKFQALQMLEMKASLNSYIYENKSGGGGSYVSTGSAPDQIKNNLVVDPTPFQVKVRSIKKYRNEIVAKELNKEKDKDKSSSKSSEDSLVEVTLSIIESKTAFSFQNSRIDDLQLKKDDLVMFYGNSIVDPGAIKYLDEMVRHQLSLGVVIESMYESFVDNSNRSNINSSYNKNNNSNSNSNSSSSSSSNGGNDIQFIQTVATLIMLKSDTIEFGIWEKLYSNGRQRHFWHNKLTGDKTWENPANKLNKYSKRKINNDIVSESCSNELDIDVSAVEQDDDNCCFWLSKIARTSVWTREWLALKSMSTDLPGCPLGLSPLCPYIMKGNAVVSVQLLSAFKEAINNHRKGIEYIIRLNSDSSSKDSFRSISNGYFDDKIMPILTGIFSDLEQLTLVNISISLLKRVAVVKDYQATRDLLNSTFINPKKPSTSLLKSGKVFEKINEIISAVNSLQSKWKNQLLVENSKENLSIGRGGNLIKVPRVVLHSGGPAAYQTSSSSSDRQSLSQNLSQSLSPCSPDRTLQISNHMSAGGQHTFGSNTHNISSLSPNYNENPIPIRLWKKLSQHYNNSQLFAIKKVCEPPSILQDTRISLIQGPPGTGKTFTLLGVISALLHCQSSNSDSTNNNSNSNQNNNHSNNSKVEAKRRLLVCTPSNAAIDEILFRLVNDKILDENGNKKSINIVRLGNEQSGGGGVGGGTGSFINSLLLENQVEFHLNGDKTYLRFLDNRNQIDRAHDEIFYVKSRLDEGDKTGIYKLEHSGDKALNRKDVSNKLFSLKESLRALFKNREFLSKDVSLLKMKLRRRLIEEADVVAGTLSSVGSPILMNQCDSGASSSSSMGSSSSSGSVLSSDPTGSNSLIGGLYSISFPIVIIDESGQACETSSIIPLKMGCTRLVLVGDPRQLRPCVLHPRADSLGLGRSLFERLEEAGHEVLMLNVQYRMHPSIREFPSHFFYSNELTDANSINDEVVAHENAQSSFIGGFLDEGGDEEESLQLAPSPPHDSTTRVVLTKELVALKLKPVNFFDLSGCNSREIKQGTSFINEVEIEFIVFMIKELRDAYRNTLLSSSDQYFQPLSIAVISPYKSQVIQIRKALGRLKQDLQNNYENNNYNNSHNEYEQMNKKILNEILNSIEVNTVDGFQGREKDVVFFSCVKTGNSSIKFISDERRLNVAITRAKRCLIVVGDREALSKQQRNVVAKSLDDPAGTVASDSHQNVWRSFLDHCRIKGYLTKVALDHMADTFTILHR